MNERFGWNYKACMKGWYRAQGSDVIKYILINTYKLIFFRGRIDGGIAPSSAPYPQNSRLAAFPHPALYETNAVFLLYQERPQRHFQRLCSRSCMARKQGCILSSIASQGIVDVLMTQRFRGLILNPKGWLKSVSSACLFWIFLYIEFASCKICRFFWGNPLFPFHLFYYRLATSTVNMRVLTNWADIT